jgi:MEDS: MEthanogen/methylotroph, DcmR Sensory domain
MDSTTSRILANPHHSHIVYPYTDPNRLVDAVGLYTSCGLASKSAVILIVTEAHRYAIERYLKADGNVEALEAAGQLLFLDAAELMSTFMVDGILYPTLFKAGMKTLIESVRRAGQADGIREVRLFGEMVSLLWPDNIATAEHLEALGNEVVKEYSIPVLCAYSVGGPGREQLSEPLLKAHSHRIAW